MCIRDRYRDEIMNRITETNKKVEKTDENLIQFREEIINKIIDVEDKIKTSIGILQKDTQEQFEILQNKVDEHYHQVEINVGQVQSQVTDNREKIEEIQQKEIINLKEEIEILKHRPMSYVPTPIGENRDVINFRDYRQNPLEFLERLEEWLNRTKENRWHMIKNLLDESFKNITDNWWKAVRNEVNNYNEFKQIFKVKYWSESIQNIVRDNLSTGKYDAVSVCPLTASYMPVSANSVPTTHKFTTMEFLRGFLYLLLKVVYILSLIHI